MTDVNYIQARRDAADDAILQTLIDGPLSTREISTRLFQRIREEWAEEQGVGGLIEWETENEPLGARLLASVSARDKGLKLQTWEILPRLYAMEKHGRVERIQIEGHRPMLWKKT